MRCVLFTGKGGVGTTTVTAATATLAAQRGNRTLVLSADPAQGLAAVLDHPLSTAPVEIESGLFAQQVDTQRAFEDRWPTMQAPLRRLWEATGADPIEAGELTVPPGAGEVLTLLHLFDQIRSGDYDVIVVDAGPIAQLLRLLTFPETLAWYLRRIVPADGRLARLLRGGSRRLGRSDWPDVTAEPLAGAAVQLQSIMDEVREILSDPSRSSVRLVLTPETVVVSRTQAAVGALALHGFGVDAVVANRVHTDAGGDAWRAGWAAVHRDQLSAVDLSFAPIPVLRAAYRAGEPIGLEELAAFAAGAYLALDPAAVLGGGGRAGIGPLRVERTGDGFSILIDLPFVERSEIALARLGADELMVSVGSQRRMLTLPSALRRCDVSGAVLRDDRLVVSFVPDPSLWART
ncbi:ArsA family ATPase [Protofrankia symbiont of Coriaria ruscifolia]|uniref:ArsA family ATPase n=1 Tax=Protofrankia symbiont of Coriaria ruscifolia TaxID=1306542 RepID=UPI001A949851|nr:ArsA family ATPase [Protofrankia symbiont of Coriaria ruscifolia]